eukprot:2198898-Prymnesium_polylepis.1
MVDDLYHDVVFETAEKLLYCLGARPGEQRLCSDAAHESALFLSYGDRLVSQVRSSAPFHHHRPPAFDIGGRGDYCPPLIRHSL